MKGIIYNAVEDAVTELYSADVWDDLLDAAKLDGHYTSLGTYDDADLLTLVSAGCPMTGLEEGELVRALGRYSFPHLANRYPELIDSSEGTYEFLRRVNDIIHPEVLKLHPDANPPKFDFEDRPDGALRVTYQSERKLGVLAEGLILGAGDRFGENVDIETIDGAGESTTIFDVRVSRTDAAE